MPSYPVTARKKRTSSIRRNTSARAQSYQINKTNKRIDRVQDKLRTEVNKYGLQHETQAQLYTEAIVMIQPAFTAGVNSPNWANCFQNSDAAINVNRARLGRVYLKMQFTAGTEDSPVTTSVFHVRLQPKNAEWIISTLGTNLQAGGGLVSPTHLVRGLAGVTSFSADTNGSVMLNPDYFIVKKQWHFTLSGTNAELNATATTNLRSTVRNISYSFPLNYTLGAGIDSWGLVSADDDTSPHLKNYILVFTNNSLADLQSNSFSILAQCTATALE